MKKLIALLIVFSVQTFAAELNLNGGESAVIQASVSTTVRCGGQSQSCSGNNPRVVCMQKGYQPSTCAVLTNGCDAAQVECLNRGYQPSTCAQ